MKKRVDYSLRMIYRLRLIRISVYGGRSLYDVKKFLYRRVQKYPFQLHFLLNDSFWDCFLVIRRFWILILDLELKQKAALMSIYRMVLELSLLCIDDQFPLLSSAIHLGIDSLSMF